jgi:signal transduction histidine kinase
MNWSRFQRSLPTYLGGSEKLSALAQRVQGEQLALFIGTSVVSTTVSMLFVTALFTTVVYERSQQLGVFVWAALVCLAIVLRYLWARPYLAKPLLAASNSKWLPVYLVLHALNGVAWGLTPWLFFNPMDPQLSVLIFLLIAGLIGGSIASAASVRSIYHVFTLPLLVLTALALAVQPDVVFRVCSAFVVLLMLNGAQVVRRFHDVVTEAFTSRLEKLDLADQLAQQVTLVEAASREKSRFLAAASHDLRQPLQAVALFSAALEQELQDTASHPTASRLQTSVQALGSSLDTMLDISQLDAGTVEKQVRPVAVRAVFQSLSEVFQPLAIDLGLELRIRASDHWVVTDPQLLERMLANLVSNALKYTHSGGVLVVVRRRSANVWIEVRDTGIGISPEHQGHIFDELYQIANPGRERHKGLGIGLAIVRRLSDFLDHAVTVHSRVGRGSCFRVVVPLARAGQVPEPAHDLKANIHRSLEMLPRRVLVLDNETNIVLALESFLRPYDIHVLGVADTQTARIALGEASANQGFDLLLCDWRLSAGEDGLDFLLEVRQSMPGLPLLLMTGETDPEHLKRAQRSGVAIVLKPVTPNALLDAFVALKGTKMHPST